ncbi:hypothetical protein [Mycobacteroides abscessus]|uniref:hypothetical protein n=1 Tax=Mycobacteroides abscessus TaxID=36809 RepID=UPI000C2562B7|nr:hypothetical protein [Mycobacteroides abscessus]
MSSMDAFREVVVTYSNTQVTVLPNPIYKKKYGWTVDARTLVKDFEYLQSEVDYWKAEALKWQEISRKLTDALATTTDKD